MIHELTKRFDFQCGDALAITWNVVFLFLFLFIYLFIYLFFLQQLDLPG